MYKNSSKIPTTKSSKRNTKRISNKTAGKIEVEKQLKRRRIKDIYR